MLTLRDRYEVLETLGSGGEARVVKALDRRHERFVALKIRPAGEGIVRADLLGEARILLAVPPHPALPLVREDFFDGDSYVVAMDWVDGTNLATLLRDRGRPGLAPSSVLSYLAQAAEALTHLHTQSPPVIHGDVKPGNLILTKGGKLKLVDFGLSSAPNMPRWRTGTAGFRAPELAAGGRPSRASDVYALAATAFALLTGSAPAGILPAWEGIDPVQAEQLEAAIRVGMATDPARRAATPGELVERLRAGWSAGLPSGVVTFCLSDIEGSTALWDEHPEAMAEALVRHDELIAHVVGVHGGSTVKTMGEGDSTVSVFDTAPNAVAAALAANRALAAEEWPPGVRIAVRWGLHTGEIERRDAEYRGPTIILAARLRAQADGGQIFLSAVTSELVAAHLPEGCDLVDLGPHRLKGLIAPERIRALKGPGVNTPLSATECPYRGLLAFEAGDRDFFFGRETIVADILGRLAPGHLLAVVGASGSGKSSVLRAGVLGAVLAGEAPRLKAVSLLTPGSDPRLDVPDEPSRLVIVDQFEELFTQCDDADRRGSFIDDLLRLRCAVAIGMRADLYGKLSGHTELARAVAGNQVLLGAMTDTELERAITEPAQRAGLKLETGLVEIVLRDVAAEPGALPLLSHALRATWERRDGRTLTVEGYRASGGVGSAIARTADAVLDALPEAQQQLTRSVFLRMTELGDDIQDTRRRVSIEELVPDGAHEETVHALLERLAEARLVMLDESSAEVAHEALIREWPRLRGWLDEDRAGIRLHRQLSQAARLWDKGGREPTDVYRGARLAGAVELAQSGRVELNVGERAFLDASVAEVDHERRAQLRSNRRLRALLAASVLLLMIAVAAGALGLIQRNHARSAESAAKAQALTSDAERVGALALSAPTLDQSLLLAVAGVKLQDRVETRGDLLAVFQHNAAAVRVVGVTQASLAAFAVSADGRVLAAGDGAGLVRFFDLRTWKPVGPSVRLPQPVSQQSMTFSPDGRTLAVGTRQDATAQLYYVNVAARRARRVGGWRGFATSGHPTTTLAYAPDGRLAVGLATDSPTSAGEAAQRLLLLDAGGRTVWQRRYPLRRGQSEAHVLFTPGGALITSAQQGDTLVWDARRGQITRRFPIGGRPALAPDGRRIALALNSPDPGHPTSAIAILDLGSGRHTTLPGALPDEWILALAFTADGKQIVGPAFNATHVWDVASGSIVETYPGTQRNGNNPGVAIDRRGLVLVVAGGGDIGVWDPNGHRRLARRFPSGCCAVFDAHRTTMATTKLDGRFQLTDLRSERLTQTLPADDGAVAVTLGFTHGRRLVTGGINRTVTIWDLPTHSVVRRLHYAEPVWAGAVSPDGNLLAVQRQTDGSQESHVEVRELTSGRALYTRTIRFGLGTVAFSRGGRELVASGCCNGGSTVTAWDAHTGALLFDRTPPVLATAFAAAPVGQTLVIGTQDGRVVPWDARSGEQRGPATKVAGTPVVQVALSPDGQLFAAAARDGTTTLWNARSRKRVGDKFPVAPGVIPGVAFEPSGRLMITDSLSGWTEWPVDRPTLQRFACAVAGRDMTRGEWLAFLPARPYGHTCPATT